MDQIPRLLRTGIAAIDQDHASLFGLDDQIASVCPRFGQNEECSQCDSATVKECDRKLCEILATLMGTAQDHFRLEEELMACLPKDHANAHKLEHAEVADRLTKLIADGRTKAIIAKPSELRGFLHDWLHEHINAYDLMLATALCTTSNAGS